MTGSESATPAGDGAAASGGDEGSLRGTVDSIVYVTVDGSFAVVRLRSEADPASRPVAVGPLAGVRPGELLHLQGAWTHHRRHGPQFKVTSFHSVAPTTAAGIERFLASRLVKGVGPALAKRIVARFGTGALEVLDRRGERLTEVAGIGPDRRDRILASWADHRQLRDVMIFLQGHGISPAYALRIHRRYGAAARRAVTENPYRLAEEVAGIGFLIADRIAASLGVDPHSPERAAAGVLHVLGAGAGRGHTQMPVDAVAEAGAELLSVDAAAVDHAIRSLCRRGAVLTCGGGRSIALPDLRRAEQRAAARLLALAGRAAPAPSAGVPRLLAAFERSSGVKLSPEQRHAASAAAAAAVLVVTGGPGTGKTTLIRAVLSLYDAADLRVQLAAPTGRAAKRIEEQAGRPASTIHRLLEYSPREGRFLRDARNPLDCDGLILDELSMVDITLLDAVLEATPDDCRLLLVGDSDQLPSVGPGDVLADLIASGACPVARLTTVFRQGDRSAIVMAAHAVNHGRMPRRSDGEAGDYFFIGRDDRAAACDTIVHLVTERMPARFGLDPRTDIQVLTPMNRGDLGTAALNRRLQEALNPTGAAIEGAADIRVGDRVMQTRNDYQLEVFNGDIGLVRDLDAEDQRVLVDFSTGPVWYEAAELDSLALAYAITIHKSQGSEFLAAVISIATEHYPMLQRNLLYTALTRARRLAVVVGSGRAARIAVANAQARERHTGLVELLAGAPSPASAPPPAGAPPLADPPRAARRAAR